jgi:HAD superfamily hydrolase (TIGR01509 family)
MSVNLSKSTSTLDSATRQIAGANRLVEALRRRRIRAVLWDLDGALVDSEGSFQAQAYSQAMEIVHGRTPPLNELGIPHTAGKSTAETFDELCETTGISAEACDKPQLMATHHLLLKTIPGSWVKLMPGVKEILSILYQNGINMAVVSRLPQWQAEKVVQSAGIGFYFDLILGTEPDANQEVDLYEMAAWKLGLSPGHCLIFEDTVAGATAETGAGCQKIIIPSAYDQNEDNYPGPTLFGTLENFDDLIRILEGN